MIIKGDLVPMGTEVFDLGSPTKRWRDVYLAGNTVDLGGTSISRDNSTGGLAISSTDSNTGEVTYPALKVDQIIPVNSNMPIDVLNSTLSNFKLYSNDKLLVEGGELHYNTESIRVVCSSNTPAVIVNQSGTCNIAEMQDSGTPIFIVKDGGNVVIGNAATTSQTTTQLPTLHVFGEAELMGDLLVTGSITTLHTDVSTSEQVIITNDGTGPALIVNQTGAEPVIDIQDDGATAFYIEDGGNVGIGTSNPAYKLHVAGTAMATDGFMAYSDARLKTNIDEISNGRDIVKHLRGVRYQPIGDAASGTSVPRKIGLIAQEVAPILPEVIKTDASGTMSIAYGEVVPVLVQAIKEQQNQINRLQDLMA